MARENKFKQRYESRNKTSTDEIIEELYKVEEAPAAEPVKVPEKVVEPAPAVTPEVVPPTIAQEEKPKEKRKVGRPKKTNEDRQLFNIRISEAEKEMLTVASTAKGMSRSDFLLDLLKEDYEKNRAYYDSVKMNIKK